MTTEHISEPVPGVRDEEILKAALKTFGERGQLMRIEDVTIAVGIGKGTLYRHYDSRVNLLRSALGYGIRELQARALAARDAVRDGAGGRAAELTAVIAELAAMNARREPGSPAVLCRLATCEQWPEPLAEAVEPVSALDALIAQWQAEGLIDAAEKPAWVTTILFGAINSPLAASACNGQVEDLAGRVSAMVQRAFPSR
ncbi:MAG TPA: TetR/AcrR family transcriptional regulator [Vicinamibacterales bacterium]|nr:TetR/AcrR family transcriptional regulator [Vicinamibacterales bacterium]